MGTSGSYVSPIDAVAALCHVKLLLVAATRKGDAHIIYARVSVKPVHVDRLRVKSKRIISFPTLWKMCNVVGFWALMSRY